MRGASMWPAAPEGSVLAVTPCTAAALRPGDLVVFRLGAAVITHRVIGVDEGGRVRAWGDALLRPDPPIAPGDVLGRARVVQRGRTGFVAAQRLGAAALRLAHRGRAGADAA
jgi:signal peptidase